MEAKMIKKLSSEKRSEFIISVVAWIIIIAIFGYVIWGIYSIGKSFAEYKAEEARCKSLGGEFGSMKCYKGGKEIW